VDVTSVHSWWFNDDLLWDTVITKAPGVPHLVQETGAQFNEALDGRAWRSDDDTAALVQRKFAMALADSAGFIQWNWNTDPYLPSDNEAAIGFLRPDGTPKSELAPFRRLAAFMAAHAARLRDREEERVWMVIPHANLFSVRTEAAEATRRCVRAMAHELGVPLRGVSEFRIAPLVRARPAAFCAGALFLVPSPCMLSDEAWQALLDAAGRGATVLITGPFDRTEHLLERPRLEAFGLRSARRAVAQDEVLLLDGIEQRLQFRGDKIQKTQTAVVDGNDRHALHERAVGAGALLWTPVPVELSDRSDPLPLLYSAALKRARLEPPLAAADRPAGVLLHAARFTDAVLCTCVSERATLSRFTLSLRGAAPAHDVRLAPGGIDLLLLNRADGSLIARLRAD
jgi:hypothetical protein